MMPMTKKAEKLYRHFNKKRRWATLDDYVKYLIKLNSGGKKKELILQRAEETKSYYKNESQKISERYDGSEAAPYLQAVDYINSQMIKHLKTGLLRLKETNPRMKPIKFR